MEFYYQVHQLDGRVENFHLSVEDENVYLDLVNDAKGKCKSIQSITEYEFLLNARADTFTVNLHADLEFPGDANGDKLGYLSHYEIV